MSQGQIVVIISGIVMAGLIIYGIYKKPAILLNLVIRGAVGVLLIHIINTILGSSAPGVGINIITVPVVCILGLPGVGLIYLVTVLMKYT